ncbi:hypothetical protein L226DRAFT_535298 [Lentinus tigrinus ALCF2SS1-7]|uniref:Uncharacterized protein n=1 Tax=Lentinus tigrinus ALCF2SS1-6 TaxID=1328759 RepID=A0A5C2SDV4_9APHY|nr:hypothetical protein L227DRAFT_609797 [Lentinus tigrinus ALCF2SS1-6]RPD74417.1 hypothetical protein L226DRAFT_535298 [Lentinus tigrinus ALCF2SS1-7]
MSSSVSRVLSLNHRQRRTFISSLFGLTFLASVVTVSASAILPCPAHPTRGRFLDGSPEADASMGANGRRGITVVEKKPRRWIEETRPVPRAPPSQPQSNAQS